MENSELQEARTNPEFLKYLEESRIEAIENENIGSLYHIMDSMLVLDLDEDKINNIYENILKIAFDKVEIIINDGRKLSLENDELFYIRAFYEHAIEKWSYDNIQGAKELFFVLTNLISNETLKAALQVHLISCAKGVNIDNFYENVDEDKEVETEALGYFITNFSFDVNEYISSHQNILDTEFENLKHIVGLN